MATLTFSPSIWCGLAALFPLTAKSSRKEVVSDRSPEDRRAERDLFKEMIWNRPEAFSSEHGACYMLDGIHGRP
jgi:hypothetical protein